MVETVLGGIKILMFKLQLCHYLTGVMAVLILLISQIKKLSPRKIKYVAQIHATRKEVKPDITLTVA